MNVCVLYSGGKDSNLALLKASEYMNVVCLVSLRPRSEESALFHYPNVDLVKLQAEALGLPLIMEYCGDEEVENVKALRRALIKAKEDFGVEGVVTGAIRSVYQATRFQKVCYDLDLWCFNPLWLRDEVSILREVVEKGFEVIFTRVAGLDKRFLGRRIDEDVVEELENLRGYVNPAGEGGEYETLVLSMPLFKRRIKILDYSVVEGEYEATLIVERAELC